MAAPSLFPPAHTPVYLLTTSLAAPGTAAFTQSSSSSSSDSPPPPYATQKLVPLQQLLASSTVAGQIVTHCHPASILNERIITLTLSRFAYTASLVTRVTGSFVLHLLEEHQAHLVATFGTHSSRNFNKFASDVACTLSPMLHHPLVSGSSAWCECVVEQIVDVEAERVVVIARVINRGGGGGKPLTVEAVKKRVTKDEWAALEASWTRDVARDTRLAEIEEVRTACPQQPSPPAKNPAATQTDSLTEESSCASHPQLGPGPLLKSRL
ncbi:hypothetical protein HDU87_000273 [Geranomyces variabilis]|uniref:Flavin reductase like domain-containing protein n=1 Tax=Geranomyces variabilis TaxID=109894 RepID=A0AAD5TSF1_9FUNG|nr:hypothetical protein HDU87_000273 [Geranomyces variabilis]